MNLRKATITTGLLVAFTAAAALTACGSDDSDGSSGGGGGGSAGSGGTTNTPDAGEDVTESDVADDVQESDTGSDVTHEAGACTDVTSISGSAVDADDAAMAEVNVVLCIYYEDGNSKCLSPEKTNASGEFTASMTGGAVCLNSAAYHMHVPDDLTMVGLYCPVDLTGGGDVTIEEPNKLVQAPDCTRDPLGDTTQPHEIVAPDGASMTVVPDELFMIGHDFEYEDLRLVTWDHETWGWPCFIDESDPPDGLVALTPDLEPKSEDAFHVSFPNDAGLSAGTAVDLYALAGAASMTWDGDILHEGDWVAIGEAEVSSDGSRIETRAGEGLPFGTWVGWKQK